MNTPTMPGPADGGPGSVPLAAPRAKIRPGRIWYLVGLIVLLGGVALLAIVPESLFSQVDSFPRVAVPAGGQVSLDHAGGYVIYYEFPPGRSVHVPPFRLRVAAASADAELGPLAPYNGTDTYSDGSHQGTALFTLQVTHPGRFTVETPRPNGLPAGGDLAFGHSFGVGVVASIAGGILLVLAGLGVLIVIFIIRIVKTNNARSPVPAWSPSTGPPVQPPTAAQPMQPPKKPPSAQPPPMPPPPAQP